MKATKTIMLLGALALAPVLSQSANAQVLPPGEPGFVGVVKSQVAGCPNIGFRIVRHSDGTVGGMSYYTDMSGASEAKGTFDRSSGAFNVQLISTMGKGPVGTITGNRGKNGGLHATLKGDGCANNVINIRGVPDMNGATGG